MLLSQPLVNMYWFPSRAPLFVQKENVAIISEPDEVGSLATVAITVWDTPDSEGTINFSGFQPFSIDVVACNLDCANECNGTAVTDCSGICNGTAINCPDWVDIPGAYQFTATFSGVVIINIDMGIGDLFAAFDNAGNVRGIAVQ